MKVSEVGSPAWRGCLNVNTERRAVSAGEIVWWTPNWGEAARQGAGRQVRGGQSGHHRQLEITVVRRPAAARADGAASGAPPDIIEAQHGWVNGYAQADLVAAARRRASRTRRTTCPAALDYVTWDGQLWGIPYRIETHAVIYNQATSTAAGLDPDSAAADLGRARRRGDRS